MAILKNAFPLLIALALAVTVACATGPVPAAKEQPLEKIRLGYSSVSGTQGVIWVAQEAGLFKKYGLDVELIYISGGSTLVKAMVAGEIPLAAFGGREVVDANLAGSDLVIVIGINNRMVHSVVTLPDIKTPEQLKGKKLGVTRFGTVTDFALRYALRRWNLDPDKDVAILQVGGIPEILGAMQGGALHGGSVSPPTTQQAKKLGFNVLMDLSATDIEYPSNEIATTKSFAKSREDLIRRFAQAYTEGVHRYKTDKAFAKKVVTQYTKLDDEEVLEDSYQLYARIFADASYPTVESMKTVLEEVSAGEPKAKDVDPASFIDRRFIKELEDSGFIKKLWEKK